MTDLGKVLLKSGTTISSWVSSSFAENQIQIKNQLWNAASSIYLSFDFWSSLSNMSLFALVGYWVNESGRLRRGLFRLKKLFGVHSGQNQAELVSYIISQYQIENTMGYFTLNNTNNNSTALCSIQSQPNQYKSTCSYSSINKDFINNSRYIRCYGHVLNLIVKVFLYGKRSFNLIKNRMEKQKIEQENK